MPTRFLGLYFAARRFTRHAAANLEFAGAMLVLALRRGLGLTRPNDEGEWGGAGGLIPVPVPVQPRKPLAQRADG